MLTQAELNYYERVPRELKNISIELNQLNKNIEALLKQLDKQTEE